MTNAGGTCTPSWTLPFACAIGALAGIAFALNFPLWFASLLPIGYVAQGCWMHRRSFATGDSPAESGVPAVRA